jgi:hypothetical protein
MENPIKFAPACRSFREAGQSGVKDKTKFNRKNSCFGRTLAVNYG